ncbi:MAG: cytochrome c, class I [Robiginitomaculum sp.]|nr:MAG: cytochrome c, class I [Robiginitomaculum sp.]
MKIQNKQWAALCILLASAALVYSSSSLAGTEPKEKKVKPNPMLIVQGAKTWKENCGRCHNLRSPKELTDEEWDVSVSHMRVRANLSKGDAEAVRAFLKASN